MADMVRSASTGKAMSQVLNSWLKLPSQKRQKYKNSTVNWLKCTAKFFVHKYNCNRKNKKIQGVVFQRLQAGGGSNQETNKCPKDISFGIRWQTSLENERNHCCFRCHRVRVQRDNRDGEVKDRSLEAVGSKRKPWVQMNKQDDSYIPNQSAK